MIASARRWVFLAAGGCVAAGACASEPRQVLTDVAFLEAGRTEKLDVYLPAREETDPPSPAVVWIHGGGWMTGDKADAREKSVCTVLSSAGYVCISVNYRKGPSSWPTSLLDCKNAVRFLRVHAAAYHADPARIAVMGGSAGGHLALMVGLTPDDNALEPNAPYPGISDEVSAIGDFYGITDLPTREEVDPTGKPLGTFKTGMEIPFGKTREADPALWRNASPVNRVGSDSPPVFIAQGLADPIVDYRQSLELEQALAQKGVAHRLVLLPKIGHTFDFLAWKGQPLGRDLRGDVLAFLAEYLGIPAHGLPPGPVAPSPRLEMSLNAGWKFFGRDHGDGANPALDDSHWETVTVPHTWNARDGEDGGDNYHRGPAWYRRHVTLDGRFAGKQLYLQFDGACFQADVYVNGRKLGSHLGGFARFRFDATDALHPGDNVLAVRVDNSALGIPPVSADFTFFGGLYRPVALIATDPVQIATMDYGSNGVFVDQTAVTATRADLLVRTEVENYEDKQRDVEVVTVIADAAGRVVATAQSRQRMGAGDGFTAAHRIALERPHLWNGRADPYEYTVLVTLRVKGKVRDAVTQPLGLRFFRADPERGFFLNGQPLDLHGVNRHQDRIDRGWAIRPAEEAEDFELLRRLGCTAVRASHYQQSDTWYQRCDRAGIVVWAEIPFVNQALPEPSFLANAKEQLRELIRQNYNHPSICFWSVGNETRDATPKTKGAVSNGVVQELAPVAKGEDASRLTTYASNGKPDEAKNWHTDVVSFNHYAGWYNGGMDDWGAYLDALHARHADRAFGISEYGAGASIYEHQLPALKPPTQGPFHPEEYQALLHEHVWPALAARPFLLDKFVWCLFDFASDGRNEGDTPGRNDKGLVTYDRRTRKDAYYYYQANWSDEPVVYLASRRFLVRHRPDTSVKVYANAPEVELTLNGRSLGRRSGTHGVFTWTDVAFSPGENNVAAAGHFGGETVTDGTTWIYEPAPRRPDPGPSPDIVPPGSAGPAPAGWTKGGRSP